jgi:drug/metabolite transporter (DMT)-like permease
MDEIGLSGAAATAAGFLLPLALLLPAAVRRWQRILAGGRELGIAGLYLAVSIALYAEGLVRGHVAQVILLFYLTPVWSTLLARLLLGQPITGQRILTIVLGLTGLVVILGVGTEIPLPRTSGQWMGLIAGMTWGVAMVYVNRTASRPLFDRVFVQFAFLGPVFLLVTLIPGGGSGVGFEARALLDVAPWLLALALVWMLPVMWLTIFAASRLEPGRIAILLMLEIVVGLSTAAWLTDEPFGPRQLTGAVLIMGAGAVEIGAGRRRTTDAVR